MAGLDLLENHLGGEFCLRFSVEEQKYLQRVDSTDLRAEKGLGAFANSGPAHAFRRENSPGVWMHDISSGNLASDRMLIMNV